MGGEEGHKTAACVQDKMGQANFSTQTKQVITVPP
jgi:hypothetical protein